MDMPNPDDWARVVDVGSVWEYFECKGAEEATTLEGCAAVGGPALPTCPLACGAQPVPKALAKAPGAFPVGADGRAVEAELRPMIPFVAVPGSSHSIGATDGVAPRRAGALVVSVFVVVLLSSRPVADAKADVAFPLDEATGAPSVLARLLVLPDAPGPEALALPPAPRTAGRTSVTRIWWPSRTPGTKKSVLSTPPTI